MFWVILLPEKIKVFHIFPDSVGTGLDTDVLLVSMHRLLCPIQRPIHQAMFVHNGKFVVHEVGVVVVANLDPVSA